MWLESQGQLPDIELEVFSALATSLEDFHSRLDWPNPRAPLLSRCVACCGAFGRLLVFSHLAVLIFEEYLRAARACSLC